MKPICKSTPFLRYPCESLRPLRRWLFAILATGLPAVPAMAQTTAFTYQGKLTDGPAPASGLHDFEFRLFDAASGGVQQGPTVTLEDFSVMGGLFTAPLDFGANFPGADRFLQIAIRPGASSGAYTTLNPRQPVTSAPYALKAASATAAGTVSSVPESALPPGVVRLNSNSDYTNPAHFINPGNSFVGDGSSLTNLSLASLGVPGTFEGVTTIHLGQENLYPSGGISPNSVAAGDLNGDGMPDMAVANGGSGTITTLRNTGTGFTLNWIITARAGARQVQLADINRDGRLDAIWLNDDNTVAVARGVGDGSFGLATFHMIWPAVISVSVGDLNSDSWPDLVVGTRITNSVALFFNDGTGGFPAAPSSALAASLAVGPVQLAEMTGDSHLDLIVAYGSGGGSETDVKVFTGNGAGNFAAPVTLVAGRGLKAMVVADINRDGARDIVVGSGQSGARVDIFTNSGTGSFTLHQSLPTVYVVSLTVGDFSDDGWPDIAVMDNGFFGYTGMRLLASDGQGRLAQAIHEVGFTNTLLAAGDMNNDGQSELIVPRLNNPGEVSIRTFAVQRNGVAVSGEFTFKAPVNFKAPVSMDAALSFGATTRQMINLWNTDYGIGVQTSNTYFRSGNDFAWYRGGIHDNAEGSPGAGGSALMQLTRTGRLGLGTTAPAYSLDVQSSQAVGRFTTTESANGAVLSLRNSSDSPDYLGAINFEGSAGTPGQIGYLADDQMVFRIGGQPGMTLDASGLTVNGTFVSSSDRNVKENFSPADARAVLDKVAALPVSEWNYKADPDTRHIGPMAQDFHAAFQVGPDDRHIATVDADGVALAAIKGLNAKVEERTDLADNRIRKLEAENAELKARLERLEQRLTARAAN